MNFRKLSASYDGSKAALQDINLSIQGGVRVGICGRTGAGKTSLHMALLRLLDPENGYIEVDGVDIASMPAAILRQRIIALPQDPTLLPGNVRTSMDPERRIKDDSKLIDTLQKVGLWDTISLRGGLDLILTEDALSQGQKQLLCLARAMLREGALVLLDEATSSVDDEVDLKAQEILKETFAGRTVITVAHRVSRSIIQESVSSCRQHINWLVAGHDRRL